MYVVHADNPVRPPWPDSPIDAHSPANRVLSFPNSGDEDLGDYIKMAPVTIKNLSSSTLPAMMRGNPPNFAQESVLAPQQQRLCSSYREIAFPSHQQASSSKNFERQT